MKSKEHILNETFALMRKVGIQSMTMDMVASNCGMSKRTIYELFGNKAELVSETIAMIHNQIGAQMQQIFDESGNCFEALMRTFILIHNSIENTPAVLQHDIRRLYPNTEKQCRAQNSKYVAGLAKVLAEAQNEGLVLAEVNVDTSAFVMVQSMHSMHDMTWEQDGPLSQIHVFDMAYVTLLRGISTIKGIEYIDEFMATKAENQLNTYKNKQ